MSKRPVIDGFVPRRSPTSMGSDTNRKLPPADLTNFQRTIAAQSPTGKVKTKTSPEVSPAAATASTLQPERAQGLSRTDIDEFER